MERPVSFSSEDIRDEKVRRDDCCRLLSAHIFVPRRSRSSVTSLRSSPRRLCSDSTSELRPRMDPSPDTSRTRPSPRVPSALLSLPPSFTSTRPDGREFLSSSRPERVCLSSRLRRTFAILTDSSLGRATALNEQKTEIRIQYKDVTQGIFAEITRNELVIRVQPGEAVYLKMNSKAPGLAMRTVPTEMDLTYKRRFSDLKIPEAYE